MEQVLAAAPDDSSRSAAKGLTSPRKWSDLGSTESLVWGKCQGSGKTPYQVSVDLNGPAFRCTCPSRKFPCKHGVALLLMWAANDGSVDTVSEASPFAREWAEERTSKQAAREERAVEKAARLAADDPDATAARAEREARRSATMEAGLTELERWVADLLRQGLADARQRPFSYWDAMAARLVDSQMPGLADRVRSLSATLVADDWIDRLPAELGRLLAIARAWRRREQLDDDTVADLRTLLGWARSSDEVLAAGTERSRWIVLGPPGRRR